MKEELISVIMPTYNRGYIIENAINSIINQTYKNFELIIVDDFSTDNTDEIVNSYKDSRIKYIKLEKNSGANFARNIGLKNAHGRYITFQDSDDISYATRLEDELAELKNQNVEWVFSSFKKISKNNVEVVPKKQIDSSLILDKMLFKNYITTQVLFLKREILEEIQFDETLPRFQDWDLIIRVAEKYNGYHLNKILLDMYIQEDSITKNPVKGYKALEKILEKYNDKFNYKQKARHYCRIATFKLLAGEVPEEEFKQSMIIDKWNLKYKLIYILYKLKLFKKIYFIIKK